MHARELVQRLILAELLARPGEGPLARRRIAPRPRAPMPPPAPPVVPPPGEGDESGQR